MRKIKPLIRLKIGTKKTSIGGKNQNKQRAKNKEGI